MSDKINIRWNNNNRAFIFKLWISLPLFFLLPIITGQRYESQIVKITDTHGASPSATFAIIEDPVGFIWFGTVDGLYRYDGYSFKIFRNDPGDPNSLSNNTIRALAIDKNSTMWIGTQGGGLDQFNILTEEFTHFIHTGEGENEISGNSIWSVMIDKKGNIWCGVSGKGLDRIDNRTRKFTHYNPLGKNKHLKQGQTIRDILEDENGLIWSGIPDEGLSILDPKTGKVIQFEHFYNSNAGLISNSIFNLHFGSDGNLWAGTFGSGINIFNKEDHSFSTLRDNSSKQGLISDLVYCIRERVPGEYWIATEYGITVYFAHENRFDHYQKSAILESGLSENRVRDIFIDSRGIIWAGTEGGVDKFLLQSQFETIRFQASGVATSNEGIVRAILEDQKGYLWIGLIDIGIIRYSPESSYFKHYKMDNKTLGGLPDNNINSIIEDHNNNIWIGGWDKGLIKYNKPTDNFTVVANARTDSTSISDNRIQLIHEEKPNIFWIGTEYGLNKYDLEKNEFKYFFHEEGNPNSLSGNSIQSRAFKIDKDGNIWIGTWSFGLNKIEFTSSDTGNYIVKHWRHNPENSNSLSNDNVISLHITKNGILWIGTFGGGLNRLDPQTNEFRNYNTDNGLPNNIIFAIFEDKNENLWLSTDHGISMFNPRELTFQNYTKSDGLQDNHFFWGAAYQNKSGKIYFGGINGITSFIPEEVKPDSTLAVPVIVDIKLFNKTIPYRGSLTTLNKLKLAYNENFLSFEFAALDYKEPKKINYRYMLKGFDKTWINNVNKRSASYTNLTPGEYTFILNVSNSDGIWNPHARELNISITPPWWQTHIARTIFILFGISLIYGINILRFRILSARNKKLEKLVHERTHKIEQQKKLLMVQTDEISLQNKELNKQKSQLSSNNEKLKQALDKLEQAQRALIDSEKMASLGVLTAGVAHEINNPLNFIAVSVENIKSELNELEMQEINIEPCVFQNFYTMLSHTETGIERILTITKSLRTYLQKEKDEGEPLHMDSIVFSSIKILNFKIPSYIKISYHLTELPKIIGHKYPLSQVVINIIENAIDAINEKQEKNEESITIASSLEKLNNSLFVCLTISNTGPSIPNESICKLFEPFFTTKQPNKGTGLGLYLSYNIIKEHNGHLTVDNINKKVNFKIYLPIAK